MEFDFYYADIQLGVKFDAEAETAFAQLTDNEVLTLQQIIYLGLNTFLLTRALYGSDVAAYRKIIDNALKAERERKNGG